MPSVVLDLDGSAGLPEAGLSLPLPAWGQILRFACTRRQLRDFDDVLRGILPPDTGTVLTGSGDFHHLSLPLIARVAEQHAPLDVVVFDNHPDNMRFPFGVHCGSWVSRAASLPGVAHVHVVGITSTDIGPAHAWENQLWPLLSGRLTYWSIGASIGWAHALGLRRAFRNHASVAELLEAFSAHMARRSTPVYLSIDKDVLSAEDARTNWDQGCMRETELCRAIEALRGRIVGSDITGEVSEANYAQWWKRLLSAIDRQPPVGEPQLSEWQAQQHALNQRLLAVIEGACSVS